VTGSGEIDITENNGTTWTALTSSNCVQPGTLAASGIVTTGYVRCSVEATVLNPVAGFRIVTNGDAVNVDFIQLENNTLATPPIPTTSGTATRAADSIVAKYGPSNGTAFTLYAKGTPTVPTNFGSTQTILSFTDSISANLVTLRRNSGTGVPSILEKVATTSLINAVIGGASAWSPNVAGRMAFSNTSGSQQGAYNGVLDSNHYTSASVPTPANTLYIGTAAGTLAQFNGYISRVAFFPVSSVNPFLVSLGP
jgi:hypothetical protein